ncbi:MAG: M20/M25/M40 family metallo-hydrolase [Candidatus Bathyarchaeia archaeon]|jgi:succinyl-diaminopimelate desuccinylase
MSSLQDKLFESLNNNRSALVTTLQDLVSIDTQVPPGLNYDHLCEVLAEKLTPLGLETSIHEATDKYLKLSGASHLKLEGSRSNLVARLRGTGAGPTLHISAHIDTAPIQEDGWTHDPLSGELTDSSPYGRSVYDSDGGYIWGRGVCDDKGPLAAAVLAIQAIKEAEIKLSGNLVLTGNCDEEIGGVAGLGYLIREGIVKADYGLQLDGDLRSINLAAQGRTRFLIRAFGKAYHGQVPILGVNAIEKMSKINVALTNYWRNVLLKRHFETPGIELPVEIRGAGIDQLTAMLNIGTIKGGIQGATVPDLCEEEVLRCMTPGENLEEVHRELVSVIEGVKVTDSDLRYEVEVINSREGYVVPISDPYAQEARRIINDVTGRDLPFSANLGSTDMNYQVVDGGMPCVNIGVGDSYTNYHKRDENVSIDELVELSKVIALFIIRKLGSRAIDN